MGLDFDKMIKSHEARRFMKACVTVVCTGIIAVYGNDPRYLAFMPFVDRLRAYLFRKLNID